MLYERYKRKIEKIAEIFKWMKRYRYILLSILAVASLSTGGFLVSKGTVRDKVECPKTIVYGDPLGYEAKGLFSDISYQYSTDAAFTSSSQEMPRMPGKYYVRAVSNGSFKSVKYGDVHSFEIIKREIEVTIANPNAVYGENPGATGDLAYDDQLTCSGFTYGDLRLAEVPVTPVGGTITAKNGKGEDVTSAYIFKPVTKNVTFTKRNVTITVGSDTKNYDALPLSFTYYDVTSGSLVEFEQGSPDRVIATYPATQTDVGQTANYVENLHILTHDGKDITNLYNITVVEGVLSVEKRPVIIKFEDSGTVQFTYDAEEHYYINYEVDESTPLVDGHQIELIDYPKLTDVDKVPNALEFRFFYEEGEGDDKEKIYVTNNYDYYTFYPEDAFLEVVKRDITLTTPNGNWVYDATGHSSPEFVLSEATEDSGLVAGHTAEWTDAIEIIDASVEVNSTTLFIYAPNEEDPSSRKNVSANYNIIYNFGTLTIHKRPINVVTGSLEVSYDDTEHQNKSWTYAEAQEGVAYYEIVDSHEWEIVDDYAPSFKYVTTEENNNVFEIEIFAGEGNDRESVTHNYDITYIYGTIRIIPRVIKIETEGEDWVYDDQVHSNTNWIYNPKTEYRILGENEDEPKHTYEITYYPTVKYVTDGVVNNALEFTVYDEAGEDVSSNYDFQIVNMGTLAITPRQITIATASHRWEYDGMPHSDTEYTVLTKNALIDGHVLSVIDSTVIRYAGTMYNQLTFIIKAGEAPRTDNYEIIQQFGTLIITDHKLEIKPVDVEKEYTGDLIGPSRFEIEYGVLDEGHHIVVENVRFKGHRIDIGTSQSYIVNATLRIVDENGDDVTDMYDITLLPGVITVLPKQVTVTAGSAGKVFDGTPLTSDEYSARGLLTGHTVYSAKTSGSQTEIGSSYNSIVPGSVVIHDADGNDVTHLYDINYETGTLRVVECALIEVQTSSSSKEYDGTPLTSEDATYTVKIGQLRPGDRVVIITTGSQTDIGDSENTYTIDILDENDVSVLDKYEIESSLGILEVEKRTVVISTGSSEKLYDGITLTNSETEYTGLLDGHTIVYTINGSQTEVGESPNSVNPKSVKIFDQDGNNVTDVLYKVTYELGTLKVTKRQLIITTYGDNKYYDGTPLTNSEHVIEGLREDEEHTMDPIVITGSQTEVGESQNTVDENSVKIYDKDGNDITESHYSITYDFGTLKVEKRTLTITTGGDEKPYDGTPLTSDKLSYDGLAEEHTLEPIIITGSQTEIGESQNTIDMSALKIVDADGNDITESHYNVVLNLGTLKVTKRPLTIITEGDEKYYDGTPLTCDKYTYSGLLEGHSIDPITITGSQTEVGKSENTIDISTLKIVDADGNDITESHYEITYDLGWLVVTKRPLTITTGSAEKHYDGTPLTNDECTVEGLREDEEHTMDPIIITGSQTEVGESQNTVDENSVKIYDKDGNDITESHYEITYNLGKLNVTKRPVTITTGSAEKHYDGIPLTSGEYSVSGLLDGHRLVEIVINGSQTEIGESLNTVLEGSVKIVDNDGNDVTDKYYELIFNYGTLKVKRYAITITTGSDEKVYDGTPLTCDEYSVDKPLLEGHRLVQITIDGSQTEVGSSDNTILEGSVKIVDKDGNDVTKSHYEITFVYGTLKVYKRQVTITAGSDQKYYDGTPLTSDKYTDSGLLNGHSIVKITIVGSQTEVGSSANTIVEGSVKIVDKDGNDITTSTYEIILADGTLTVEKRPVTIVTETDSKIYDGTPLINHGFSTKNLLPGHTLTVKVNGSQTEVGESDNTFDAATVKIVDKDGNDITNVYYTMAEPELGKLTVTQRQATISTNSAWKVYDGEPLTCDQYSADNLIEGHEISEITITGSQTEIGKSPNTVDESSIKIVDKDGKDVTSYYLINYDLGTLTVREEGEDDSDSDNDSESIGGSLDLSGDLGDGAQPGDLPEGKGSLVLEIKSTTSGTVYLRLASFGDYTGQGWAQATEYEKYIIDNYGFNYLVALALRLSENGELSKLEINSFTTDYLLPYFLEMTNTDHTVQGSDVIYTGTHNGNYSVYYYSYDGDFSRLRVDLGELTEVEKLYREFVYSQYLTVGPDTKEFIQNLIEEQGWNKYDPNIISKVQEYVQNCATYNLEYDRNLDKEEDVVVAFLGDKYNEGVCRHYAATATLIFRTLGIPARYTVGYVGNTVADEWTEVRSTSAHAWTEIYIDGIGWIPVEVTGAGAGGNVGGGGGGGSTGGDFGDLDFEDISLELEISPVDVSKAYDGEPLYAKNELKAPYNSALERLLYLGFTYDVVVSGSRIELGVSESKIESIIIYDPNGSNVTEKFTITCLPGEIKITAPQIIIDLYDIQKEYDGTPISYRPNDYQAVGLPTGYKLFLELEGSVTETGEFDIELLRNLEYTILDENGTDVTDNFYLEFEGPGIIVSRRVIEIRSASAKREYNGQELTDDTVFISFGSLIEGHTLHCNVTGTITEVGVKENTIDDYVILDENGNDVTLCYEVTKINGTLEVIKGSAV